MEDITTKKPRRKKGFTNPHNEEKQNSRYHILEYCDALLGDAENIQALTLPASNFIFENIVAKDAAYKGRVEFTCVEKRKEVHHEGKYIIPTEVVKYIRSDVFAFLDQCEKKFNFIWLDLCSSLTKNLLGQLGEVVQGKCIADECLFCVTILKAREFEGKQIVKQYGSLEYFREVIVPKQIIHSATEANRKCTLLEIHNYLSESPMSIYIFKIKKLSDHGTKKLKKTRLDTRTA